MGAKWTVHQQRPAFNVGMPEMQPYVFTSTEVAAEAGVL
jgi:hypothetical protein